jgi:2-(1,2-epoxy-1,2-dihydrophenyl)acetyl-CoA isomerase
VRALLLKGAGRAFCAGGDVSKFDGTEPFEEVADRTIRLFHPAVLALANLSIPTVAAIQGAAAGAGIGLMLACDFVIATPSTRFTLAYPKIGATIDGGASWFLPRLVGTRKAKELAMLSDALDGVQAEKLGLVTRLVTPEMLEDEAIRFTQMLSQGPTEAFGAIKHLVEHALSRSLETQLDAERDAFIGIAQSPDFAEGLGAYREKRSPVFFGRR